MLSNNKELTPLQNAFLVIKKLQQKIEEFKEKPIAQEDIAVIGISCNLPGKIYAADDLWEALLEGKDLITDRGLANRWKGIFNEDDRACKNAVPHAGLLDNIAGFDHDFFNISPLEAQQMDPQHRHMLMVAYKAFEDAGIATYSLKGSSTGVFVGIGAVDYSIHVAQQNNASPYMGSGNSLSGASGRLSYYFGLNGPSLSIDTACSSSLVALHQACLSLKQNECDLALVGGINFLHSPHLQESLTEAGMLAADGRCKTFDDSANGYVRSEGCLALILKKRSDAEKDGDRIYACIKGTAIAQDGASGGLTVPNPQAQALVIKKAMKNANITANDIDFLEAHGTGTSLGDPVELEGIKLALNDRNIPQKIRIGSVKTNLGHLEAAAGLAGVAKACLSVYHRQLPKHLHYKTPNKHISWEDLPVAVNTNNHDYSSSAQLLIGGVSSFGFTGSIAHCIVAEHPQNHLQAVSHSNTFTLQISAPSLDTLEVLRKIYVDYLLKTKNNLHDICYTAMVGRNNYKYAIVVEADTLKNMVTALKEATPSDLTLNHDIEKIKGKKISLPHYPFNLNTHWLGSPPGQIQTSSQYELKWKPINDKNLQLSNNHSQTTYIYINPSDCGLLTCLRELHEITVIPIYWREINTDNLYSLLDKYKDQSTHIIYDVSSLWNSTEEDNYNLKFQTAYKNALGLLQELSAYQPAVRSFTLLTQEAVQVSKNDIAITEALQYSLRAWVKSVALEIPDLFLRSVDISKDTKSEDLNSLGILNWLQQQQYPQLAIRQNQIFYEVIQPISSDTLRSTVAIKDDGVYLVTGGNGSLGKNIAMWLVDQGAKQVILASRHAEENLPYQHKIIYKNLDVSDVSSVMSLQNWFTTNSIKLSGIIHAAGISYRMTFKEMQPKDIDKAAQTKVNGLHHLSNCLSLENIDFFVVYSSIASVWGSTMLSHYTAVNAYMDAYIHKLRKQGVPAKSISWGPWAESNMMQQDEDSTTYLQETGITAHRAEKVEKLYGQLLHPQYSHEIFAQIDRKRFTTIMEMKRTSSFWDELRPLKEAEKLTEKNELKSDLNDNLQALKPVERAKKIKEILVAELCIQLAISDSTKVDVRRSFSEMGMDSILIIRFVEKLQQLFNQPINSNMIFNYPNIEVLAKHISETFFVATTPVNLAMNTLADGISASIETAITEMDEEELKAMINADIQKYI